MFFSLLTASVSGVAWCGDSGDGRPDESSASLEESSTPLDQVILLGASVRRFDYLEEGTGGGDSERGTLPGLSLGYFLQAPESAWFISVGADGLNGYTAYSGGSLDHSILVSRPTNDALLDAEAEVGLTLFRPDRDTRIEAYTGIGYHFWRRGGAATVGEVGFFREDYSWWILPVGMRLERDIGSRVTGALELEGRMAFGGHLKAYLSQLSPDWGDATVPLGGEPGFRVGMPIEIRLARTLGLLVSPWFEYSAIGGSEPFEVRLGDGSGTGVYRGEPASRTYQYGASAGVAVSI